MSDEGTQQRGPFGTGWALQRLFDLALPRLSEEELQSIATGASGHSQAVASQCATVLEGIGCLVHGDEDSGALLLEHEVAAMLLHAAGVMREISALQYMATGAALALSQRGSRTGGERSTA